MLKKLLAVVITAAIACTANAQPQTKAELQKQQTLLQNEIAALNKDLGDIKKQKNKPLAELKAVTRKLEAREELVRNINREISRLKDEVYYTNLDIYRLNNELDTLKQQYAQSVVFAYKNRSNYDYLNFLFSAKSFNDALKRVEYLKSYRRLRETQVNSIVKTQAVLQQKIASFNASQKEQGVAMQNQTKEINNLENDKQEVNTTLNTLKSKEGEISNQLAKKNKQRKAVANAIAAAIKREREEAIRLAKIEADRIKKAKADADALAKKNAGSTTGTKPATTKGTTAPVGGDPSTGVVSTKRNNREYSVFEETDKGLETSLNFEANKGKLPWPVESGTIVTKFGTTNISNVLKQNCDGIEIGTPVGSNVKSVANGIVKVAADVGEGWMVIVQHGKYWTTYTHLSSVNVSKFQEVKAGTVLGKAAADDSGDGMVLFMVTNERGTNFNPESWLRRK